LLHAVIVTNDERYATADCHAKVGDITVAQSKLFFSFLPIKEFAPDIRDEVLEAYLAGQEHEPGLRSAGNVCWSPAAPVALAAQFR
jgi:hypothetical protein